MGRIRISHNFLRRHLLRNPSLAGLFAGDIRFQAVYRNQWQSVTTPYQTGSLNFEYKQPVGMAMILLQQDFKYYMIVQVLQILLLQICILQ